MSKKIVVVRFPEGIRVLVNPKESTFRAFEHVIDPDLSSVRGVPPEEWSIEGGKVVSHLTARLPPAESTGNEITVSRLVGRVNEHSEKLKNLSAALGANERFFRVARGELQRGQSLLLYSVIALALNAVLTWVIAI